MAGRVRSYNIDVSLDIANQWSGRVYFDEIKFVILFKLVKISSAQSRFGRIPLFVKYPCLTYGQDTYESWFR